MLAAALLLTFSWFPTKSPIPVVLLTLISVWTIFAVISLVLSSRNIPLLFVPPTVIFPRVKPPAALPLKLVFKVPSDTRIPLLLLPLNAIWVPFNVVVPEPFWNIPLLSVPPIVIAEFVSVTIPLPLFTTPLLNFPVLVFITTRVKLASPPLTIIPLLLLPFKSICVEVAAVPALPA